MSQITSTTSFFIALVAAAALVNAAGYLLTLWHDETVFDEAVHLYTSFAVMAALGWLASGRPPFPHSAPPWWAFVVSGLILGLAWEVIEWIAGIIGGRRDTAMDLAMDTLGAAAAAALVQFAYRRGTKTAP